MGSCIQVDAEHAQSRTSTNKSSFMDDPDEQCLTCYYLLSGLFLDNDQVQSQDTKMLASGEFANYCQL